MRTSVLLGALVLLAALFVAANAVPEDVSAVEDSRRVLKEETPKMSCMEEFKKSRKECVRDHMCSTDECMTKTDRCIAKAYKRFKICKFPPKKQESPPPPPPCKKLCKMLYEACKKDNKGSCGMKYNNCVMNNCS
ncbi:unnamed protein product [Closterium sp. Yama58-4]|nr:unnamed protein product [Closterium sp. Yama58-4]